LQASRKKSPVESASDVNEIKPSPIKCQLSSAEEREHRYKDVGVKDRNAYII